MYTGNAAAPSTAGWTLTKAGPLYYYCDVEEHCPKHMMYATINVLETAGAALKTPGVKSVPPPATLKTPTPTNGTASPTPVVSSAVRTDKQISIAVFCGALLSLARYFLI